MTVMAYEIALHRSLIPYVTCKITAIKHGIC